MNDLEPTLRVAAVQMDVAFADVDCNVSRVLSFLDDAAGGGARLAVFPECVLTGYGFGGVEEALPVAQAAALAIPRIAGACARLGVTAVVGTLLPDGCSIYNSAIIFLPDGSQPAVYRKCHLPWLGVDKVAGKGQSLDVVETPAGRLGTLICYDLRFPEAARTLALRGAEIICVPTNWPQGAETAPGFVTRARAWENRAFVAACNRVGSERGFTFIGRSQIVNPSGEILAEAGASEEVILTADIRPHDAHEKKVIVRKGEFEMDLFGDRRPEIYE
ncbi:MAG TPA: carbon-nitrogen hydrolase family protein [Armatimonadota bacterium]|jgi:predicted amidohydrolase